MNEKHKRKFGMFTSTIVSLVIIYGLVVWGIPFVSRKITGLDFPLPVPGTLVIFYAALVLLGAFIYISFDQERLEDFLTPIRKLFRGDYGNGTLWVVVVLVSLFVSKSVYSFTAPKVSEPVSLRIQHPSSNFPKQNETLQNPFRNPSEETIGQFVEEARGGQWDMVYTTAMVNLKKELGSGNPKAETAKAAYMDRLVFEGRVLYQKNCRPCHGVLTDGNGPMADGFKLRPINFSDNGTIETIVEGYTFWRVRNGGPGLPVEATPWDSAMPIWKNDLTDDQIWKIILAEYDTAEKTPRIPEKVENKEGGK